MEYSGRQPLQGPEGHLEWPWERWEQLRPLDGTSEWDEKNLHSQTAKRIEWNFNILRESKLIFNESVEEGLPIK